MRISFVGVNTRELRKVEERRRPRFEKTESPPDSCLSSHEEIGLADCFPSIEDILDTHQVRLGPERS